MSIHIGARKGQIAETVLLPGDPLRAKFVAENFLDNAECYTEVRGMYGYTGTYNGKRVSVQGTGMGIPSHLIYVNELINDYGARRLIRIGSCGAMQKELKLQDILIAMTASTDSAINSQRFGGADYAPCASFPLFQAACNAAERLGIAYTAGGILSSDVFYGDDPESWKQWAAFGALAVEMETSGLYTQCAKLGAQALSLLTVSDSLVSGQALSSEERQTTFRDMMRLALEIS